MFNIFKNALKKTKEKIQEVVGIEKKEKLPKDVLEEALIEADIEYDLVEKIIDKLPNEVSKDKLKKELEKIFNVPENKIEINDKPYVFLIIGVNGAGKTTTIAKLAFKYKNEGYSVILGAKTADNFFEVIIDGTYTCVVEAIGAGEDPRGKTADFMRPTLIIVDDVESKKGNYNVQKKKLRQKLEDWFDEDLVPGLHPTEGRLIFLGTIIHKDSLLSRCMRDDDYVSFNVPIIQNGKSSWKSRFPMELILSIKNAYAKRGRLSSFFREYMNKPVADEKILFKEEYFKYFSHIEYHQEIEQRVIKNVVKTLVINIRKPKYIIFKDGSKLDIKACTIRTTMDVASGDDTGDKSALVTVASAAVTSTS